MKRTTNRTRLNMLARARTALTIIGCLSLVSCVGVRVTDADLNVLDNEFILDEAAGPLNVVVIGEAPGQTQAFSSAVTELGWNVLKRLHPGDLASIPRLLAGARRLDSSILDAHDEALLGGSDILLIVCTTPGGRPDDPKSVRVDALIIDRVKRIRAATYAAKCWGNPFNKSHLPETRALTALAADLVERIRVARSTVLSAQGK